MENRRHTMSSVLGRWPWHLLIATALVKSYLSYVCVESDNIEIAECT